MIKNKKFKTPQSCTHSLTKFSQIYDKATPMEIKELLPYFVESIIFTPEEIKIALFDQPTDKGLFLVNHSNQSSLELSEWLPDHPQNPNFSYEVYLGLTNAKSGDRWIILN